MALERNSEVTRMKPDRPLILSVLLLAAGLGLIFGYCHGSAGLTAALPISGASFNLCTTTTGPGALGGFALTMLGFLLLIWSLLCAIVSQIRLIGSGRKREEPPKDEFPGN
ncbi:MAG: hypothetical protein ABSC88_06755 [Terracidiphilus sp.]|jgi:hypothetical protein